MSDSKAFVELGERRASAIVRCDDQQVAAAAMEAAVRGGFRVVEFTLTVPGAMDLIADFAAHDHLVVGAGTVLTIEQADAAIDAGASFLVSPVTDAAVIRHALERGVEVVPGCHTPTEMMAAHDAGARLQKLFPAPAGGPVWLRSLLGPMPFLNVVPTNGVDASNAGRWLEAGAFAVGFATVLFEPELLAAKDYVGVEARAIELLAAVAGG